MLDYQGAETPLKPERFADRKCMRCANDERVIARSIARNNADAADAGLPRGGNAAQARALGRP